VNLKESKDFSQEVIDELNMQKCTTKTNELCHIFLFNKHMTSEVIEQGLQKDLQRKVKFLKNLNLDKKFTSETIWRGKNRSEVKFLRSCIKVRIKESHLKVKH
jgi:hypothetical protein